MSKEKISMNAIATDIFKSYFTYETKSKASSGLLKTLVFCRGQFYRWEKGIYR